MDFELSDEQRLLKDSVERLLRQRYDVEARHKYAQEPDGFSRKVWRQFAELGLLGLAFEEKHGGIGGGPVETMIVMEAFGHALVIEPYIASVVLSGSLLRIGGSEAQRDELLPKIAEGELLMAFAHAERQSRYDLADVATTARKEGGGFVLDGAKTLVLHGDSADKLIVSARLSGARPDKGGIGLFLVDASAQGLSRRGYATNDSQRAAEVTLSNVRVPAEAAIGPPDAYPLIEQRRRLGHRRAMRRGGRRHERNPGHDGRIPQDAQAVRRADRQFPGAAAPRRRNAGRARAGAQHGHARRHDGER